MVNHLPEDVERDILSRLPVKSLIRFRCVCRRWLLLLQDPSFVHLHLTRSKENSPNTALVMPVSGSLDLLDLDRLTQGFSPLEAIIVSRELISIPGSPLHISSCNGLLCFSYLSATDSSRRQTVHVYNPVTRQGLSLPRSPLYDRLSDDKDVKVSRGIGFHAATREYKVVRIFSWYRQQQAEVEICTLGGGGDSLSWRNIGKIPHTLNWISAGVFIDGALHWQQENKDGTMVHMPIVSIDMGSEKFHVIKLPPIGKIVKNLRMIEWKGCLGLVEYLDRNKFECNIWVFKKDHHHPGKGSWTKDFSMEWNISYQGWCYPLFVQKNGEVLVLGRNMLHSYNLQEKRFTYSRSIEFLAETSNPYLRYTPSLVGWMLQEPKVKKQDKRGIPERWDDWWWP